MNLILSANLVWFPLPTIGALVCGSNPAGNTECARPLLRMIASQSVNIWNNYLLAERQGLVRFEVWLELIGFDVFSRLCSIFRISQPYSFLPTGTARVSSHLGWTHGYAHHRMTCIESKDASIKLSCDVMLVGFSHCHLYSHAGWIL